jgi:error-prone DNA polymerase
MILAWADIARGVSFIERMFDGYVELHCHSAYSFLDGASMPDELVPRALELGHTALALTDHNGVYGSMEHAQVARSLGLKAIHGAELDLDDGRHLTLLVESSRGWTSLCRLITHAHAHTRAPEGGPIRDTPRVSLEQVLDHADGLVCLSGCATRGLHDLRSLRRLREVFGPDRLRIELQRPYLRNDRGRNRALEALAKRLGVPTVATGDVHAHDRSRALLQDAFVAIREHTTLDASEPLRRGNHAHVLSAPAAMAARFGDHPDAVAETARLAERLNFDLCEDLGYRYPGSEDRTAPRRLAELCAARLEERYPPGHRHRAAALQRTGEELDLIDRLDLAGFFLLHHDLLELAREVAVEVRGTNTARALLPPGRGRGSSVSSIVCYLTGLSHVDPIENELLLGRFLNDEITALPDIDLDFPRDVREVLLPRVHERYGRERSALVAAFPTYRSRGAIRELGKALGLPPGEIERVARGSEGLAKDVEGDIAAAYGRDKARSVEPGGRLGRPPGRPHLGGRWGWLAWLADQAMGLPRHLSQHPGGMVVATRPLIDCCPAVPAAMAGRQMIQWDKDSSGDAGFLKIDLLGLGMLSAVERCVEEIARTRNERIDLSRIPYDDPETYAAIQKADTVGVFQIESRAQMASLRRTRPASLDDLTIQVAIVRPGPIQGGAVNPYIARLQRLRADPSFEVPYDHPCLEPVLEDTLGTIIFQDQVIEVAMAFAGFGAGEAEGLRRVMSKRRSEAAMEEYHRRFVAGAQARYDDVDAALAERVWDMVKGFSGFGFPKAHGAAFGLLAYQSTWLRVHYGPEFLAGLLNEQPMGFYPPDSLAHEAKRRGTTMLPVDVNRSAVDCHVEDGAVRLGLRYVSGLRREDAEAVATHAPYSCTGDFAARSGLGRPGLASLAWAGAVDVLAGDRRAALWQLGVAAPGERMDGGTQLALPLDLPAAPRLRELNDWESLLADYGTTGVTLGAHPLELLRPTLPAEAVTSADLHHLPHGRPVTVGGLVIARQRPSTAKGVVFLLIEDEHGTVNVIVPPPVYERYRHAARAEPLVLCEGILEKPPEGGGQINLLVDRVTGLHRPDQDDADVRELREEPEVAADDFSAVAPAVQSFASGRRR